MKNKTVKAGLLIVLVTLLCSVLFVSASAETTADGFTYTIHNNEATITGYEGTSTDLIIPSTVDGCPVVAIGDYAFEECSNFTGALVIPDGVTTIGDFAFAFCDGLVGELVLPENLTVVEKNTFRGCDGFTKLVISDSVTRIENNAFDSCRGLAGELVIPESVTTIGDSSFAYCYSLTNLVISEGVTTIKSNAFSYCRGLTDVYIPVSIKNIRKDMFNGIYSFSHVIYGGTAEQWATLCENNGITELEGVTYLHADFDAAEDTDAIVTRPTCSEYGYTTYFCSCGYSYVAEYTVPTEDHDWFTYDNIPACTGGTATYYCYNCDSSKEEYIEPTDEHSWIGLPTDAIYCAGGIVHWWCECCPATKDEYIEPKGHLYQFVSDNNATCTEDGTKHEYCSRCEDIGETVVDEGSKLGHDLTETTVLSQTTCTQDGISVQACKRCAEIVATIEGAYGHFDNDGDGKCDECKVVLEVILPEVPSEPETDVTPEEPEVPEEPQESTDILSKLIELFNKILNILKKLFGI